LVSSSGTVKLKTLALVLIPWVLFVWLGWDVGRDRTRGVDTEARAIVLEVGTPLLTRTMRGFTYLGEVAILFSLSFVGLAGFYRWRKTAHMQAIVVSAAGGELLQQAFKHLYHRARPEPFFNTIRPDTYSFPSGHAMMSCTILLTLAWLVNTHIRSGPRRLAVWSVAVLLALCIGTSRIYLGVHYASDVLGGYLLSLGWIAAMRAIYARHL
jgi:undecaprenyl-diphosphatase